MIPLTGTTPEMKLTEEMTRRVAEAVTAEMGTRVPYMVGTMIEVPRAALIADQMARYAEFFSFGTNDLTQMTYGYSRDDIGKFLPFYLDKKLLPVDPVRRAGSGRSRRADSTRHRAGPADAAGPEDRHLRRARRGAVLGRVLSPGRHGPTSRARRTRCRSPGWRGAGRDREEPRAGEALPARGRDGRARAERGRRIAEPPTR